MICVQKESAEESGEFVRTREPEAEDEQVPEQSALAAAMSLISGRHEPTTGTMPSELSMDTSVREASIENKHNVNEELLSCL